MREEIERDHPLYSEITALKSCPRLVAAKTANLEAPVTTFDKVGRKYVHPDT